jgi:hypothetical protein
VLKKIKIQFIFITIFSILNMGLMTGGCTPDESGSIDYGYIKADNVSYPLAYGQMVTTDSSTPGIYLTEIELYTSKLTFENGNANIVFITLYHSEKTPPSSTYSVLKFLDDNVWANRFICNIIINDDKNYACTSGTLTFEPSTGKYTISVDTIALCSSEYTEYPIKIEYSGPIEQLTNKHLYKK